MYFRGRNPKGVPSLLVDSSLASWDETVFNSALAVIGLAVLMLEYKLECG